MNAGTVPAASSPTGRRRSRRSTTASQPPLLHPSGWQRSGLIRKKIFDEHDYPYSLVPLIEAWSSGRRVLDLGCGASQLLPLLMQREFDAVGFEGDPARVEVARENGVRILSGDWRKIADIVGSNRFDCVVSDQVFEHMLDPIGTLAGLKPILRPVAW
jgi:SAM-dependent methyltransferase